ncbi:MAG TPA: MFS transporter [Gemmatimonadaceae bacterium]|nr:MFS transporter [Gemmatimonadaceae bacterium]
MATPRDDRATPSPGQGAWAGLAVLTLINLFNYIDRLVLPAVNESLRHSEIHPSDTQLGLLSTAFLIVYMLSAPAIGLRADRGPRPRLLAVGIALWSVATALGGLARTFPQLLAARATVGIGEAAYGTIAPAMLADYFPSHLRARVFSVFYAAIPVGSALGYVLGGLVDARWGWRAAFFVAGVPGLVLAVFAWLMRDPERGAHDDPDIHATHSIPGGIGTYGVLLRNKPYFLTVLGYAAYTFALGGIAVWMPSFLERIRGVPRVQANVQLGAVLVVTGFVGTFAGGWIGDWLLKRVANAYLWVSAVATIAAAPLAFVALAVPDRGIYFTSLVIAEVLVFASTGPINTVIVGVVAPTMRAAAMALSILAIHLLGDVPSPPLIGWISDRSSLATAVMLIPAAVLIAGLIWLWAAVRGHGAAGDVAPATGDSR